MTDFGAAHTTRCRRLAGGDGHGDRYQIVYDGALLAAVSDRAGILALVDDAVLRILYHDVPHRRVRHRLHADLDPVKAHNAVARAARSRRSRC